VGGFLSSFAKILSCCLAGPVRAPTWSANTGLAREEQRGTASFTMDDQRLSQRLCESTAAKLQSFEITRASYVHVEYSDERSSKRSREFGKRRRRKKISFSLSSSLSF
jgi:hypothetical protein